MKLPSHNFDQQKIWKSIFLVKSLTTSIKSVKIFKNAQYSHISVHLCTPNKLAEQILMAVAFYL